MSQPSVHINKSFLVNHQLRIPKIFVNPNFAPPPAPSVPNQQIHVNPRVFVKRIEDRRNNSSVSSKTMDNRNSAPKILNGKTIGNQNTAIKGIGNQNKDVGNNKCSIYSATKIVRKPVTSPTIYVPKQKTILSTRTKLIRTNSATTRTKPIRTNSATPSARPILCTPSKLVRNSTNVIKKLNTGTLPNFKQKTFASIMTTSNNLINMKKLSSRTTPTPVKHKTSASIITRTKLVRIPQQKPSTCVHTKYKIVRSSPKEPKPKRVYCFKSKFAIDYRLAQKQSPSKRASKTTNPSNSKKCVRISGVLYRKDKFSLVRTSNGSQNRFKLVTARGRLYKYDTCKKTLVLLKDLNKSNTRGINKSPKRILLSQSKRRNVALQSKLRKSNIPCPFFRKYGRCKGKENKTCFRVHNPDQILLCPRFLQGACTNTKCLLSHNVSAEKMPTCKFFLDGMCIKDDCPYPHVKVNASAEICRDFVEGFCKRATECEKRHQYLCPDYEKYGECKRPRCSYPHGAIVGRVQFSREISYKLRVTRRVSTKRKAMEEVKPGCARYYTEAKGSEDATNCLPKRPKLGELPSFIPF